MTEGPASALDARVLVVSSRLWSGYNDLWDAVEKDVSALTVVGAKAVSHLAEANPPSTHVGLRAIDLGRGLIWEHLVGLRRLVRHFSPDVVHVNRELWALVAQELMTCDARIVVHGAENLWSHGGRLERTLRDGLVDRAVRRLAGYASWNHAGADHVRMIRGRLGLPPVPDAILPAVVPPAEYHAVAWHPVTTRPLDVLLVGRATPAKGFQDVIDAVSELGDVRLTLCGQGPMVGELVRRAAERGVSLQLLGHLGRPDLARRMAQADLLVQPSRTTPDWAEQFGRTVAEAMSVGLPCLVSDSGELPHLVGHDPRAVFPEGDLACLRQRIDDLATPGRLEELSHAQRPLADVWRVERAGAAVVDLWKRVLG